MSYVFALVPVGLFLLWGIGYVCRHGALIGEFWIVVLFLEIVFLLVMVLWFFTRTSNRKRFERFENDLGTVCQDRHDDRSSE